MESVVVCRYGELFLKSGNRGSSNARWPTTTRAAARRSAAGARRADARPAARARPQADATTRPRGWSASSAWSSLSVARQVDADGRPRGDHGQAVSEAQAAIARDRPASFKIEARRADKRFAPTSMDIARQVGARVQAATGLAVDVHTPALRLGVEVGTDVAYVFAARTTRRAGCRWARRAARCCCCRAASIRRSAGWLAAKRGLALDAVYFHSPPYIGEKSRDKVLALGKQLARWQALRSVTIVPFTDVQKRLRDAGPAELAVVLYRRMMMRIADADRRQAGARPRW